MASESCSSTENNGCSSCGPSLSLWGLSVSTSLSAQGHPAYNGSGKVYLSENITASSQYLFSYNGEIWQFERPPGGGDYEIVATPAVGNSISNESGNARSTYVYYIDEYGDLYIWVDSMSSTNTSSSDSGQNFEICYPSGSGFSTSTSNANAGGVSRSRGYVDECNIKMDTNTKCRSSNNYSISVVSPSPYCPNGGDSSSGYSCGSVSFSVNDPNPSETTKSEISETSEGGGCELGGFIQRETCTNSSSIVKNANLSTKIDAKFLHPKARGMVNTKISLQEENEEQNCAGAKCGSGGKDDCWGGPGSIGIADNNLDDPDATSTTYQKWKFKIGTSKEEFNKEYKSVSGKIYFYYDGDGKTPCCDEDFDGTVVKEQGYSVSAGSTFKNEYFASDAGDFDNNDQSLVGKTINICYTIDNVSFI